MKPIAELSVQDVDAAPERTVPLFVRCQRDAAHDADVEAATPGDLVVEVICTPEVYQARVPASHKPRALDCSASEYLAALEAALTPRLSWELGATRFKFKWSRAKRVLTLMENAADAGFAMKYTSVAFDLLTTTDSAGSYWDDLLHGVVQQNEKARGDLVTESRNHRELETLLRDKDAMLERALEAKQRAEDRLFEGFCAVLNTKKDEIRRLRDQLASGDGSDDVSALAPPKTTSAPKKKKAAPRKRPVGKRPRRTTGARLNRAEPEEKNDLQPSIKHSPERSSDETQAEESDDAGSSSLQTRRKRAKNASTSAAPAEPENVVLQIPVQPEGNNDAPIPEANATETPTDEPPTASWRARSRETSAPPSANLMATATGAQDGEAQSHSGVFPETLPITTAFQVSPTKAADSEEEDILDMLS